MKKAFFAIALLAAALTVSCSKVTVQEEFAADTSVKGTLVVSASKAAVTKGLELKEGYVDAFWEADDTVEVFSTEGQGCLGYLVPSEYGNTSTTLEGTVDISELEVGDRVFLLYHGKGDMSYSLQDGTLEGIAREHETAGTSVSVESKENGRVTTEEASFQNYQAIVKFKIRDELGNPMNVVSLTVAAPSLYSKLTSYGSAFDVEYGAATAVPSTPTDELFVSLCMIDNSNWCDYYLCAQGTNGRYYECLKEDVRFDSGMYYEGTVKMQLVRYTVVGCSGPLGETGPDRVFGTAWDYYASANDMVPEDGVFKKSYRLKKGDIIYFKVVKNRSWENAIPEGDNRIVTAWADGTLNIEYDPLYGDIYAEMEYDEEEIDIETVYTVVGDRSAVFGSSWQIWTPENDMTYQPDGRYKITYTGLTPGSLNFRIVEDRSWEYVYPDNYESAYNVSIPTFGDLTIYYSPFSEQITTSFEPGEAPDADYYLSGSFNYWRIDDSYIMTKQTDGTYTYEVPFFAADPYVSLKVVLDGNWDVCWPEYGNYEAEVPAMGVLTVIFNPNTGEISTSFAEQTIEVSFTVAGSTGGTAAGEDDILFGKAWDPTLTANDMQYLENEGYFYKEYAVSAPASIEMKVVKNHSWDESWPAENFVVEALGPGKLLVAYAFGYGMEAIMQYTVDNYAVSGRFCDWEVLSGNVMTLQPDGTYTKTISFDADVYKEVYVFKNGSIDVGYIEIPVEGACTVTITFNPATGDVTYTVVG